MRSARIAGSKLQLLFNNWPVHAHVNNTVRDAGSSQKSDEDDALEGVHQRSTSNLVSRHSSPEAYRHNMRCAAWRNVQN